MKTTLKFLMFGSIVLALILTSCSPEDGADGAVGPQGAMGSAGVDGADGTDGQDGNANVFSSDWFDIVWSATNATFGFHDEAAPEMTADAIETSVILVYLKFNDTFLYSLPVSWTATATINFRVEEGTLRIWYEDETNFTPPVSEARYVIIPATTSGKNKHLDFHKMTYEQVMDHFGLEY